MSDIVISEALRSQAQAAREASIVLANLSTEQKNQALRAIARKLRSKSSAILQANGQDLHHAKLLVDQGELSASACKRLILNEQKIEQMALNMEHVAALPDPVGIIQRATRLDHGLELYRVSTPIGVLLIIFESRPEVVVQISALTIKSGNAVILKGGQEARHSNQILSDLIVEVLDGLDCFPSNTVHLIQTREDVSQIVKMQEYIDLIVPRGSNAMVRHIQENSRIPVLAHADGICHVYLDEFASPEKSKTVVMDSKTQYPAVCNAMETLLIHQNLDPDLVARILLELQQAQVELRVCPKTRERLSAFSGLRLEEATEEDWRTEYTDLILSVKTVSSLEAAVDHINHYGSKHTDAIVTENRERAEWFMNQVDAANVFWNASTRFADGFRYGFGAEIGVSTCKTHARGPVGLEGLVIYKYKLYGQGQGVAHYEKPENKFLHEPIAPPET